ncbi:MAG: hypothetical protein A3G59_00080 [Candidatus Taylorbacteria bacterium RIFCSPLOWO2_12_FULL_47_20]|uniref:Cohesin domain-containing protein n=1 Tax=Candidatus Taylorbacteria bacterium RIFCSPLOWO2_12_FULL_47_20 TaxID=1802335 RepID=A0A1G2P782_9BACT|nr:MAG: hypothetical protein A3G59_00080 [Candidatus Taylorbacteria bacterium RIFCSPLOWO2_12_FULL_47_20]
MKQIWFVIPLCSAILSANAAIRIDSIQRTNNDVVISLSGGNPRYWYDFEMTRDFTGWSTIGSALSDYNGDVGLVAFLVSVDRVNDFGFIRAKETLPTVNISLDSATPAKRIVAGSSINVPVTVLQLDAVHEPTILEKLPLRIGENDPSRNFYKGTIWDGSVKIGEFYPIPNETNTTCYLNPGLFLPSGASKRLTVKIDTSGIGISDPGIPGSLIKVDFNEADTNNCGFGLVSGLVAKAQGATEAQGVILQKSYPVVRWYWLPSNSLMSGRRDLICFSVTASTYGPIGLSKVSVEVVTVGYPLQVDAFNCYAYYDSAFSMPVTGLQPDGAFSDVDISPTSERIGIVARGTGERRMVTIPTGETRYFAVRANINGPVYAANSVLTKLLSDKVEQSPRMDTAAQMETRANFVWTPLSFSAFGSPTNSDWTDGFCVEGLVPEIHDGLYR